MTRILFTLTVLLFAAASSAVFAQTWEVAPTLPGTAPRIFAIGVNDNGTIYAIGGTPWQNGGDMDGSVHRLLPGATSWETVTPLSGLGPVVGQAAGIDGLGRIVVYGGFILGDDGPGDEATYEPIDGPSGGVEARDVPEEAIGYTAYASDDQNRLYGLGGGPGAGGSNSGYCDRYIAATDTWEAIAPLPTPVSDACAAFDRNGHILVCGGINEDGTSRVANVAQYDIATNVWSDSAVAELPVALSGARAICGIDGRIYVAGGEAGPIGNGTTQAAVYKWEPSTNAWSAIAGMATPRKHFAIALSDDDYIYAIGGDNDNGGTNLVERIFTPRCPSFDQQPQDQAAWSGSIAAFSVVASGATPLTYRWQRDGQPLSDGATVSGSDITGATTATLRILNPSANDDGIYQVVASNSCGSTTSDAANLVVQPTPNIPTAWKVVNLHPAWAQDSSAAVGISNGRIGGSAVTPTLLPDGRTLTLDHPVVWDDMTSPGIDVTPGNSIGGAIRDVAGELFVGWYWHIYNCLPPTSGTCGWQSAAYWTGPTLAFTEASHLSGPEYDHCIGTDGTSVVGTLTYEYTEGNYSSRATMWTPPGSAVSLHSAAIGGNSGASAVDGQYQYGSYTSAPPGPVTHAARWSGSAATFLDIHPAGFSRSWVSGAGDGQAVGTAVAGSTNHAIMWVGGLATIDLTPAGEAASAVDAAHGLQVGSVGNRAALWAGSANSFFDLTSVLPADYTIGRANGLEVDTDGNIYVVGSAYSTATGRYEAIVWSTDVNDPLTGDVDCNSVVDFNDGIALAAVLVGADADSCHVDAADLNADGINNGSDISSFINILIGN